MWRVIGDIGFIGGASLYGVGVYQNNYNYQSYGFWTIFGFSVYTLVSDIIYSADYNNKLREGLWLADAQPIPMRQYWQ